jgi:hypothetical protein
MVSRLLPHSTQLNSNACPAVALSLLKAFVPRIRHPVGVHCAINTVPLFLCLCPAAMTSLCLWCLSPAAFWPLWDYQCGEPSQSAAGSACLSCTSLASQFARCNKCCLCSCCKTGSLSHRPHSLCADPSCAECPLGAGTRSQCCKPGSAVYRAIGMLQARASTDAIFKDWGVEGSSMDRLKVTPWLLHG